MATRKLAAVDATSERVSVMKRMSSRAVNAARSGCRLGMVLNPAKGKRSLSSKKASMSALWLVSGRPHHAEYCWRWSASRCGWTSSLSGQAMFLLGTPMSSNFSR